MRCEVFVDKLFWWRHRRELVNSREIPTPSTDVVSEDTGRGYNPLLEGKESMVWNVHVVT